MSNYQYKLSEFQAIKSAEIKLDGITVLAGENGCGKSTLSRWLYYLVNTINQYDDLLVKSFIRDTVRSLDRLTRFFLIEFERQPVARPDDLYKIGDIDKLSIIYKKMYADLRENIIPWLENPRISKNRKERAFHYLNIPYSENIEELKENVHDFAGSQIVEYENRVRALSLKKYRRDIQSLFNFIYADYDESPTTRPEIQFIEQGTPILSQSDFNHLYQLKRAIYVDTPMALGHKDVQSKAWTSLQNMMVNEYQEKPKEADRLIFTISKITGGHFDVVDEDFMLNKEIHYIRRDGLDIELGKAATGLNAFAYLQLLLKNGYLDEETLLLIDEPEAHLHPQWIVEFARILVQIHKILGVNIMIASHNPDMVSAIHSIAQKEEVLEDTNFYLAKKDEESWKYTYKALGTDISEIFQSFNIALSRIAEYGG